MALRIKRAYEKPARADGVRILVDRIWPRGVSKDEAKIDHWVKEIAPSVALRKWFGHDPERWGEFVARYRKYLAKNQKAVAELVALSRGRRATLVYAARDEAHNNAVALAEYLHGKV